MAKWEYRCLRRNGELLTAVPGGWRSDTETSDMRPGVDRFGDVLSRLGLESWELVTVDNETAFLKRHLGE